MIHNGVMAFPIILQLIHDLFSRRFFLYLLAYEPEQEITGSMILISPGDINQFVDQLWYIALVFVNMLEYLQRISPACRNHVDLADRNIAATIHISALTWALNASDKFLLKIIILSLFKNVEVLSVHEISLCKYK